jgi:hypothetical protein
MVFTKNNCRKYPLEVVAGAAAFFVACSRKGDAISEFIVIITAQVLKNTMANN